MDFSFTPEQEALRDLARRILDDRLTHERLRTIEATPDWFDRELWAELAKANLLGLALPEDVGGGGLGLVELCLLLEAVGWAAAPIPAWATLVLGAWPIAEVGTAEQRTRWLRGVSTGDVILTAALAEPGADDPTKPSTRARKDGNAWRLDGVKTCVPAAHLATRVVVPAATDGGAGLFLLDLRGAGVRSARQEATNGEPLAELTLTGAPGEALGDPRQAPLDALVQRALVGLCAMETGVVERALRMTAQYVSTREQFGKPLATFQAVAQRAADAFIDVEAVRWTTWQAAWRLAERLPAADEVRVAKFWAAEGGHRVTYAAQHLHGGIGIDLDYPLHRYYVWSKAIELTLGSATPHLVALGASLAKAATR